MNNGDYLETTGWQGGVIPGINDTARFNWGNNTVTLAGEAPLLRNFQMGVDESGQLIVTSGGILNTTGTQNSTVGNNGGAGVVGRLTINTGGIVNVTNVLFVGANATGILTNDGGALAISSHLWGGSAAVGVGTISIRNGGVINVGGNIGLGTAAAPAPHPAGDVRFSASKTVAFLTWPIFLPPIQSSPTRSWIFPVAAWSRFRVTA
ncbi:MAG: hypothetical protein QM813_13310 [Verrucomicrobiota bacterium]